MLVIRGVMQSEIKMSYTTEEVIYTTEEVIVEGTTISGEKVSSTLDRLLDGYRASDLRIMFQENEIESLYVRIGSVGFNVKKAHYTP